MGSTLSTAHRVQFRRALYLYYFDDKLVHIVRVVLLWYYPSLFLWPTVRMGGVGSLRNLGNLESLGCPVRDTRKNRVLTSSSLELKSVVLRQPHSKADVVRQSCTPVLTCTSEQRNFATKPPFVKGRFGGNVNIFL